MRIVPGGPAKSIHAFPSASKSERGTERRRATSTVPTASPGSPSTSRLRRRTTPSLSRGISVCPTRPPSASTCSVPPSTPVSPYSVTSPVASTIRPRVFRTASISALSARRLVCSVNCTSYAITLAPAASSQSMTFACMVRSIGQPSSRSWWVCSSICTTTRSSGGAWAPRTAKRQSTVRNSLESSGGVKPITSPTPVITAPTPSSAIERELLTAPARGSSGRRAPGSCACGSGRAPRRRPRGPRRRCLRSAPPSATTCRARSP